jgi:hypothetical protein
MRTIIAGSRGLTDMQYINDAVAASRFLITEVVCGMAPGIDLLGKEWADYLGIPVKEMPANWHPFAPPDHKRLDRAAGYKRNKRMAEYAQAAVVCWNGTSPGSKHMIDLAYLYNLQLYIHYI